MVTSSGPSSLGTDWCNTGLITRLDYSRMLFVLSDREVQRLLQRRTLCDAYQFGDSPKQ